MFEEEFDFPEDGLFEEENESQQRSSHKQELSSGNTVCRVKPEWFLQDSGHPEGFPPIELEMSRAFLYYKEGKNFLSVSRSSFHFISF